MIIKVKKYIDVLYNCPLFKGKEKNEILDILSLTNHKINDYNKNEFIFRAHETPVYIGVILDGSIEFQNNLKSGKYYNVLYKKKGEVFGGALVLSDSSIYKFDVIGKTKCTLLLIHKQSVQNILFKDLTISKNIISLFSKSVMMLTKKIELFSYSSIQQKIAYCLLTNISSEENNIIHLPYSKKAWAEHINVSRSSLSRELKKLSDSGIIKVKNKVIKVLDKEELEKILDDM
jgi:CRP-like cAMP-binding protein